MTSDADRRSFLKTTAAAAAMGLAPIGAAAGRVRPDPAAGDGDGKNLRLLFLGGTGFLGPHTVEAALARGHTVTLFNRGRTNPDLFADLEKLRGDRDGDLKALEGREWDAVIDTSGYVPRIVRDSAALLADHVKQYVFISTLSVYAGHDQPGADESAPVGTLEDETVEEVTGETYGPLKALCEKAAAEATGERATIIRPGLIVGPRDPTDRFTYWPVRIDRAGEVLAPGDGRDPVQYVDARDLGLWTIRCIEEERLGVYNAVTPAGRFTMAELLHGCKAALSSDAAFTWVDADFLEARGVRAWADMPAWVPARGEYAGFGLVSSARAAAAGLAFRPLAETAADTLAWFRTLPDERRASLRAGIAPDREIEVLEAWHQRDESKATEQSDD